MSAVLAGSASDLIVADDTEAADTGAPVLLLTGMPGAGKTNYALATFALGKRDVYQCNIPDCKLPAFDPEKWPEEIKSMAVDATLIFDECREIFPPKNATQDPPPHYVLNRVRHTGRRPVLICQHPSDIDARVRRLCTRHIHFVEAFGGGASKTYEWRGKIGDVDGSKSDAIEGKYGHNKAVFKLYKSTEMHRGSAKKPWKLRAIKWVLLASFLALCLGAWYVYHSMMRINGASTTVGPVGLPRNMVDTSMSSGGGKDRILTKLEYVQSFVPRVAGLQYSAPRFDAVTKPVRAPVPAACVESAAKGCKCYTQQATPLDVPLEMCKQFVAGGVFVDFEAEGQAKRSPEQPVAPVVAAASPARYVGSSLGSIGPVDTLPPVSAPAPENGGPSTSTRGLALPKP